MREAGSRFAGSTQPAVIRSLLLGSVAVLLLAGAVVAGPADAAVIHKPAGTFNILEAPGSPPPMAIALDEGGGYVYVLGRYNGEIEKFDLEGHEVAFSGIPGPNEHQGVHFEGGWFEGDAFTLTCPKSSPETTAEIEWNAAPGVLEANIKAALEAKCGGTATVTGPGGDARNIDVEFGGTLGHADLPEFSCAKVSGSGTCYTTGGADGAASTNKLRVACGGCYQIAVDNSGGPNQGVIYISSNDTLTTCCPENQTVPNPPGGIHAYLPSGLPTHSKYRGNPVEHPYEYEAGYGEPLGGLYTRSQEDFDKRACGVAVDADGNLIIAHGGESQEYSYFDKLGILPWASNDQQEGTLLGTINSDTQGPCRLQLDSDGDLYYMPQTTGSSFPEGPIKTYSPDFHAASGTGSIPPESKDPSTLFHEGPDVSFALDSEDHVYALRASGPPRVQQLDQSGSLTETFAVGELLEPADIAVDKATGTIFVTDGSFEGGVPDIHLFKAFTVPNSITEPFAGTTQTSGVLSGEVDLAEAGEEVTSCEFEYTTEALFIAQEFEGATKVPCDEGTKFTANESVSTEVTGLTLEEPYKFRLVTANANGVSNGSVRTFLSHAVVDLTTKAASNVAPRSATLNGSFTGNGDGTEFFFEIGHGQPGVYTESTPKQDAGEPSGAAPIFAPVSNLELETTYHYRVVAINGTGESKGFDESFKTPPAVAGLTTEPASGIGQDTITLNAKFTGDGHDTKYYFEYGPTSSYGLLSGEDPIEAGTTTGPTPISSEISTYHGNTTYHYRVVAKNDLGTTYGKDMTFTTDPVPKPIVAGTEVDQVTPTTASVSAMVTPNRLDASWLFEWGETTDYGTFTEAEPVITGITTQTFPIATTITGLAPGTTYHFRAVAFNFSGVTEGADVTFKTPSAPEIEATGSSAVAATTAHLSALVLSNESATDVHFEFGPGAGYGSSTRVVAIGADPLARESGVDLTGLTPGTTYHYRAVATNQYGTTNGSDQTFTTPPAASTLPLPSSPPPKKCPKGKVKKHGKCVQKRKPKNKKSTRHGDRDGRHG